MDVVDLFTWDKVNSFMCVPLHVPSRLGWTGGKARLIGNSRVVCTAKVGLDFKSCLVGRRAYILHHPLWSSINIIIKIIEFLHTCIHASMSFPCISLPKVMAEFSLLLLMMLLRVIKVCIEHRKNQTATPLQYSDWIYLLTLRSKLIYFWTFSQMRNIWIKIW